MKVIHYIPSIDKKSGGVGAFMQLLARDLGKLCQLHILTHKSDDELELQNCEIHYLPYKWLPWNSCKNEFLHLLNEIKPNIVHSNCCWMPLSALMAMWAKNAGYKVVYTPHGMLEPYAIKRHYWTKKLPAILLFQKNGVKVSDLLHATADSEKENLLQLGWNKNVHVVANCVQIDEIKIKTSWKRTKTILFLSRVHPKKGIEFLIEAISKLKEKFKGYKVIIAGPGEEKYIDTLKSKCRSMGVENIFSFVGPVFGSAKWPLYQNADLFVLPTYSENFGIVVPEALASGTPVITTVGTPWMELNTEGCGWCTEIGTEATVNALVSFLEKSEDDLKQMGMRGRDLVERKYTSTAVALEFIEMYTMLLQD